MKAKQFLVLALIALLTTSFATGCATLRSQFKDMGAEILGLERTFKVYDDYGTETMTVTGTRTDMQPSEVENVLLIEVDGSRWQHVGSTLIAYENDLKNHIDGYRDALNLSGKGGTITAIDKALNQFFSNAIGLSRIIIVKTQAGVPIAVFEGDNVLVEASTLPQTTKILIDNKRLHIYRADLEIIESSLFDK